MPVRRDGGLRVEDPKTTVAVGAMIAALAQSQLPDFSFRSDLLRSRSIAKFIGKLDGGGRLQREDLVYRDVDLDNREYSTRWNSPSPSMPSAMPARRRSASRSRASSRATRTRATSNASACAR